MSAAKMGRVKESPALASFLRRVVRRARELPTSLVHLLSVALDGLEAWPEEPSLAWAEHHPDRLSAEGLDARGGG